MIFFTLFAVFVSVFFSVYSDGQSVTVMEGDSVILHTDVNITQKDKIKWYISNIRVAQINGDLSKTCTDVQCNEGTERFRDRLKLDHQTGSLTIMNTNKTDDGEYHLEIISKISSAKTFTVSIIDAEQGDMKKISVAEGESVTLDTGVIRKLHDMMAWYFNDILITEITGDQSQISTDDQCNDERFKDRLELDHQTGSLTIMNTKTTDSGEYKLKITSNRFTIIKSFNVTSSANKSLPLDRSSCLAGICGFGITLLLLLLLLLFFFLRHRKSSHSMKKSLPDEKSVIEKDSVTLNTEITDIGENDIILWRFGNIVFAEICLETSHLFKYDEGFKEGLEKDES